jgi:hypothetical protein
MLKVYEISTKPCFVTGKCEPTNLFVKFDDRSFTGVLAIQELLKQIQRRSNAKAAERDAGKRVAPSE